MPNETAVPFSVLSPSILDREDRLRVARQILAVLEHQLGTRGLGGRRLLDIGCSSGVITTFLAAVSGPAIGVDVDEQALARAREQARPGLEFRRMSGTTLDLPSQSVDVVICNQMYYWLDDPARLMAEIFRVLTPGGVCFFATVNKYKPWEAQYRLPLLPILPRGAADWLVRATGRGDRFACHYLSHRQLRVLCSAFVIHSYTARILRDPKAYQFSNLSSIGAVTRLIPQRALEALEPICPNIIWVLAKPDDKNEGPT